MEIGEALFVVVALVAGVLGMIYLERFKTSGSEVVLTIISCIFLSSMFIKSLIENFSSRRLAVVSLLVSISVYMTYRKYRKYKRENPTT
jgi:general stress protein CsbA